MTKAVIIILVLVAIAAGYGFAFGLNSWSDEQAWYLLGLIALVLGGWALGAYINRNESSPRK